MRNGDRAMQPVADSTCGPILEACSLRLTRPTGWTLDVPHLAVARGEVLALLGPNGAGKSTLLHALALLERPDAGDLWLDGRPVVQQALAARRRMAVVLQEPMPTTGDVTANVGLGLRLHHIPRAERDRRVRLWLERTGIAHLARRRARSLSGGEQRRVSLARALALNPLVLFMDEPFAAVDAPSRRALLADLPGWLRAAGCAAVLVTHDREEALHLADRVAVLFDGRIRQIGPVDDVFSRPADTDVAAFLGVENIIPGRVVASDGDTCRVRVGAADLTVATATVPGPVLVTIHPEMVLLLPPTEHLRSSARNLLCCRVVSLDPAGGQMRARLDAGFPLVAALTRAGAADLDLAPGARVTAAIKATAIHLIPRP
jgi:tungstate transport system ATP-binding protein